VHYDAARRDHGLPHDPFKALVAPRPIGWIGTVDREGRANLAPYSFFNAVSDRPPLVVFSSGGYKHSVANIVDTGEFTCSLATYDLREQMNLSSASVADDVDEFALTGLAKAASRFVAAPRVAAAPAALECRLWKTVALPTEAGASDHTLVIGQVVGIYIDDAFIDANGRVDTAAMRPIARMGYMDYATVTPETSFVMNRPSTSADKRSATVPAAWDGRYR
jgi:flavin reductase (DIM6/NTAB) family NADH-FMN oxidoreductase RutF